ncbi:MAG TPA: ABC transporter substrate-binding protein [Polyangiales bacterium]
MKRTDLLSALWFALAVFATVYLGLERADAKRAASTPVQAGTLAAGVQYGTLANGERGLMDANGVLVPIRPYQRVATYSTISDGLAFALLEPERIVVLSDYGKAHSDEAHRYGAREVLAGPHTLEQLVELRVDLLFINHLGSQSELARLREAGIQVFNLGDMRGLTTLLPNIAAFSTLIDAPARGQLYADKLMRRLRAVAADIPLEGRRSALYVSSYANQLFGGASGTSYHDVLIHAGLRDVATEHAFTGWPHYDPEQLIELDPELIVADAGTGEALCRVGGLASLRACKDGGVVMLPTALLGDPGPRMLEAAEALRERVYGPRR